MALSRIKIKDVIKISDERNIRGFDYDFFGININKEFMPSVANTSKVDRRKYKILRKKRFVFSGMQTGRDNCIRIGMYDNDTPVLVSPAYTTFEVTNPAILPEYFFMIFRSKEMDRYGAFLSDSSVRSNLDWDRFCDIELTVPPIEIQKKYVAIYEAMLDNQKAYKKGLDDLKLVCDGYIEELRKNYKPELIGRYLLENKEKNVGADAKILGISKEGFIEPKQKVGNEKNYTLFGFDDFVYSPPRINVGSIGLFKENTKCACSPIYVSFRIIDKGQLCPDYLLLWFKREEFKRYTDFYSIASVRNNFSFDLLREMKLPIPPIEIQKSIVEVLNAFNQRKLFANSLNKQMTDICPVLIRGSLLESLK